MAADLLQSARAIPPELTNGGRADRIAASAAPHPTTDYEDLFVHAPVGYMLLDDAGRIQQINRAGAALLGWDAEWLQGKPFSRWVVQNDKQLFRAHQHKLCSRRYCVSSALRVKRRQGRTVSVRLESTRTPANGDRGGCRSIIIDLSDEQQNARTLRRLEAQLNHVARLHTAGELTATLAHELNQPLGTITLNCDAALRLLQNGGADDYEFAETLTQAREAASFASEVVRHLRRFLSASDELHVLSSLPEIIGDVATLIEAYARDDDIELKLDIAPNLPPVRVDAVQIGQVLLNLAQNAIEAMRAHPDGAAYVAIRAQTAAADHIQIRVADTGPGLSRNTVGRIFAPFYTTKANGMGMGLAISRRIIETHGGQLWADSGNTNGACFLFTLPTVSSDGFGD